MSDFVCVNVMLQEYQKMQLDEEDEYEKRVHFLLKLCTSSAYGKTLRQYDKNQ